MRCGRRAVFLTPDGRTSLIDWRVRLERGDQVLITAISGPTPKIHHSLEVVGQDVEAHLGSDLVERVRKWVAPIQDLRVPNGCSTVCRRTPMASGMRSSEACILSSTSSFSQRLMRRSLVGVHRDLSGQVKQAVRRRSQLR